MAVGHELAHLRCLFKRFAFENGGISCNQIEEFGFDHKIAAVDPALTDLGLFLKRNDTVPLYLQFTKSRTGVNSSHRDQLSVAAMKIRKLFDIDVGHAISVSHQKGLVAQI